MRQSFPFSPSRFVSFSWPVFHYSLFLGIYQVFNSFRLEKFWGKHLGSRIRWPKGNAGGWWEKISIRIFNSGRHLFMVFPFFYEWIVLILAWFERSLPLAQVIYMTKLSLTVKNDDATSVQEKCVCSGGHSNSHNSSLQLLFIIIIFLSRSSFSN